MQEFCRVVARILRAPLATLLLWWGYWEPVPETVLRVGVLHSVSFGPHRAVTVTGLCDRDVMMWPGGSAARPPMSRCTGVFLAALCFRWALASPGDRDPLFLSCAADCEAHQCAPSPLPSVGILHKALGQLSWRCADECRYTCMHERTAIRLAGGDEVLQYDGKWPFWRALGMQEPAAVAFSLLNLCAHVRGLRRLGTILPTCRSGYYSLYWLVGVVSANAWLWAAIFHIRDCPLTEALDYHSASAIQIVSFYCALSRVCALEHRDRGPVQGVTSTVLSVGLLCVYCAHVAYLARDEAFDYGYNMKFNIAFGAASALLWLSWLLWPFLCRVVRGQGITRAPCHAPEPRPGGTMLLLFLGALGSSVLFEVLDFPDLRLTLFGRWVSRGLLGGESHLSLGLAGGYGVLDAHAMWHAATVCLTPIWYAFAVVDSVDAKNGRTKTE
jgi:hypothetical protein